MGPNNRHYGHKNGVETIYGNTRRGSTVSTINLDVNAAVLCVSMPWNALHDKRSRDKPQALTQILQSNAPNRDSEMDG